MAKKPQAKKSTTKKKSNHLFDAIGAINSKQSIDYDPKQASAYIITLFLSEDPSLLRVINDDINRLHFHLTDKMIFKYYHKQVPAKNRRLSFTKKSAEAVDRDEEIKHLMETYNISKREASLSL